MLRDSSTKHRLRLIRKKRTLEMTVIHNQIHSDYCTLWKWILLYVYFFALKEEKHVARFSFHSFPNATLSNTIFACRWVSDLLFFCTMENNDLNIYILLADISIIVISCQLDPLILNRNCYLNNTRKIV